MARSLALALVLLLVGLHAAAALAEDPPGSRALRTPTPRVLPEREGPEAEPADESEPAEDDDAEDEDDDDDRIRDIPNAIDEVVWTVEETATVREVAGDWGIRSHSLIRLNPTLEDRDEEVGAGTELVVFVRNPEKPTLSIERPTDGKLRRGVPLPEGDGWVSPSRRFQWGTQLAVTTFLEVMATYRERYPEADPIRVGDLSRRRGGEIERRHESHQTGRDIDLGYPRFDEVPDDQIDNPPVTAETLDVEKTWFLVETLLETENVQVIFIDKEVQTLLDAHVRERYPSVTKEELAMLFEHPRRVHSHRAIIQHWNHHDDHMHVRFRCDPGNWLCRGNGVWGEE